MITKDKMIDDLADRYIKACKDCPYLSEQLTFIQFYEKVVEKLEKDFECIIADKV